MSNQYTRLGPGIYRVSTVQDPISDVTLNLYTQSSGNDTSYYITFVGTNTTIPSKNKVYTSSGLSFNPNKNVISFASSSLTFNSSLTNQSIVGFGTSDVTFSNSVVINKNLVVLGNFQPPPNLAVSNISAGSTGDLLYQYAPGITSFISPGTVDYVLTSNGPGVPPSFKVSTAGVGSYVPNAGVASYANVAGIATVATYANTSGISSFAAISGYSTSSGISSTSNYASVSGVSTYSNLSGVSTTSNFSVISGYSTNAGISSYSVVSGFSTTSNYALVAGVSTYSAISGLSSTSNSSKNISAGSTGDLLYQYSPGITSFISPGTVDYILTSNGPGVPPSFKVSTAGNIVSSTYTASGPISTTDRLALINATSAVTMTLAAGSSDGHTLLIKRIGTGSVTVTASLDGSSSSIVADSPTIKESVLLAWSSSLSTWLIL